MMSPNFLVIALTALVPSVIGFIWYNPKVLGNAWMKASGLTEESLKGANMALIMGVSLVLSFFLAMSLNFMVIHQFSFYAVFQKELADGNVSAELAALIKSFEELGSGNFRTFKHGALHGTIAGLMVVLPVLGTNALFERKGFKYIAINVGYWTVTLAIMGGILCQFG
jgi:hypothetical protein